jgi:hypothetical protein
MNIGTCHCTLKGDYTLYDVKTKSEKELQFMVEFLHFPGKRSKVALLPIQALS